MLGLQLYPSELKTELPKAKYFCRQKGSKIFIMFVRFIEEIV
jgi:hypothetical protein